MCCCFICNFLKELKGSLGEKGKGRKEREKTLTPLPPFLEKRKESSTGQ
jgi:hypothetical protein